MTFWSIGNNYSSSNSSSLSSMTNLLGEYSSIKTGGYKKLLEKYYKENPVSNGNQESGSVKEPDSKADLLKVRSQADELRKAISAMNTNGDTSIFNKVKVTSTNEETGEVTETEEYDRDAISKAVKSFVNSYNEMMGTVGDLNTNALLKKGVLMTTATSANSKLLAKAGITVGKDNKLSVDETKLKEADIGALKTLFNGSGSFADRVGQRAEQLGAQAARAGNASRLYGVNGKYSSYSSGNFYNSVF